jgi:hypothetical protein
MAAHPNFVKHSHFLRIATTPHQCDHCNTGEDLFEIQPGNEYVTIEWTCANGEEDGLIICKACVETMHKLLHPH